PDANREHPDQGCAAISLVRVFYARGHVAPDLLNFQLAIFPPWGKSRLRATRPLDQLRQAQKETIGLATGGQPYQSTGLAENPVAPTLASQGIDKNLAHLALNDSQKARRCAFALGRLSDTWPL